MSDEDVTKQMGQLLRKGAALLNKACPKCNTPLLRLTDNSMYCAKCDSTIVEKPAKRKKPKAPQPSDDVLSQIATKVLANLEILYQTLPEHPHPEEIRTFAVTVRDLIETLRAIRELQQ